MLGWLRRRRSHDSGETGWSVDPAPTPDERRDELLSAYLDDDLTAAEQAELEARLETDASLRDALAGMRTVRDTLATLEVVRAPRSFAITAPEPAPRRGLRPIDLAARAGAMVAAVAFVVVLAGDLSDGGGTPIVQGDSASTAIDADADTAALAQTVEAESASAAAFDASQPVQAPDPGGAAPDAADDVAEEPAPTQTPEAPLLDDEPTVQAAAQATAERSATEGPATDAASGTPEPANTGSDGTNGAQQAAPLAPNTGGASDPAADGAADPPVEEGAPSEDTPPDDAASDDAESSPLELPQPAAEDADTTRVEDEDAAGTAATESALGTQSGDTFAAVVTDEATGLAEDGREVSNLAVALGAVAALLAATAGLLWWRRREGTVGPI